MHTGPITLPDTIKLRCYALINLGSMLQLFDINLFMRVIEVRQRMTNNCIRIQHLQELDSLCKAIIGTEAINNSLRDDIEELSTVINLFIQMASHPTRPCGMWNSQFVA